MWAPDSKECAFILCACVSGAQHRVGVCGRKDGDGNVQADQSTGRGDLAE